VVCFGVLFSLTTFYTIRSWQHKNIDKAFKFSAEERANQVTGAFETELGMLDLVRAALMTDGRIDRQEFREILEPFIARSHDIRAVEWVPRVPDSRRAEFEEAARRDGLEGFTFTEEDKNGKIVPAAQRNEYFPIYYIGPQEGSKGVYGYDIGSEPTRLEALRKVCETGATVASGRIAFVQDPPDSPGGFFVCLPVYKKDMPSKTPEDRQKYLMGYILGVFRPRDMIESAIAGLRPEGIDVALYDPSESAAGLPFYIHTAREEGVAPDPNRLLDPKSVRVLKPLGVAGHPWTVICAPTPGFYAARETWWPMGVLIMGLVFTGMTAGYLLTSLNHAASLEEKVREQTVDIRKTQEEVLFRLASASQWCDEETPMHLRRVSLMSQALAKAADWYGDDVEAIRQAAPMHDIGKIGIPDAILRKTEKLTPQEFDILKTHTRIGAEILAGSNVPMLKMAHDIALGHHERWDGQGYPKGLSGTDVPESARIVAIVDAYDTLTHESSSRVALSEKEALTMMQQESGKRFDPDLLIAFFRRLPELRHIAEQHPDRRRASSQVPPASVAQTPTTTAAPITYPTQDSSFTPTT
jgi:CHASE1-domain containing sensor protein/HD superfamily phosphodiesterase